MSSGRLAALVGRLTHRCRARRSLAYYEPADAPPMRCTLRAGHVGRHQAPFGTYFDTPTEGTP